MTAEIRVARALISVSDKTGIVEFARFLSERGVEILSTGGSAKTLREAGITIVEVADHTGFPEIMDGRVKTLHPRIHGGILGRRDAPEHVQAMAAHGIAPIDLVIVNLYPFAATVASGASFSESVENIDIGGPALIRAAAKNHDFVAVVTNPADYDMVLSELRRLESGTDLALRVKLAATAYAHTAGYDAAIAAWFRTAQPNVFPEKLVFTAERRQFLRYGENPHQEAVFYVGAIDTASRQRPGLATAVQIQGKELSYNNLGDTDAAMELAAEYAPPAFAIIKHGNPCGVAVGVSLLEAYKRALACDPVSAFGGVIAANRTLDGDTAAEIGKIFTEVIVAPEADARARAALAAKKNLRLLITGGMPDPSATGMTLRSVGGGFLVQARDNGRASHVEVKIATKRAPTPAEMDDLLFAFSVCKHVKSNAIVYAKNGRTVGIGAGQMSRVDSSRIAAWKAEETGHAAGESTRRTEGSVVASDAFFPFADGLLAAAAAGATAVIQPGGSVKDAEVIAAADQAGLAMVFTGIRHFRH